MPYNTIKLQEKDQTENKTGGTRIVSNKIL